MLVHLSHWMAFWIIVKSIFPGSVSIFGSANVSSRHLNPVYHMEKEMLCRKCGKFGPFGEREKQAAKASLIRCLEVRS